MMPLVRSAHYEIVSKDPLTLRDLGPWDQWKTITNAAEEVVVGLVSMGHVPGEGPAEIRYYDSLGSLDRILVQDGRFAGFAFGPGEETS